MCVQWDLLDDSDPRMGTRFACFVPRAGSQWLENYTLLTPCETVAMITVFQRAVTGKHRSFNPSEVIQWRGVAYFNRPSREACEAARSSLVERVDEVDHGPHRRHIFSANFSGNAGVLVVESRRPDRVETRRYSCNSREMRLRFMVGHHATRRSQHRRLVAHS